MVATGTMIRMNTNHPLVLKVPPLWQSALDSWEQEMTVSGLRERTIGTRLRHVRQAARALKPDPREVTSVELLDWVSERSWQLETRHAYYSSLRSFFGFIKGVNSPALALPHIHRPNALPRPVPDTQLIEALKSASPRTRQILLLGACVGLRASEIARVHINDFFHDLHGYSLHVVGKGGVSRFVPIDRGFAEELMECARANNGWLFPGKDQGHLSPRYVSKLGSCALASPWTLHTLRHRFATTAYRNSHDLIAVQRLLGHSSVATTQRYTAPADDALRLVAESTHLNVSHP